MEHGTRVGGVFHPLDSSYPFFPFSPVWTHWDFRSFWPFRLKGVEQELESTAQRMGAQADRLYKTIEENDVLQKKIQKNLEAQVMQSILTAALKYDINDNFTFDAAEIKRLKVSISQIPGVDVDSNNFDQFMNATAGKKEMRISDLMRQFRNIMHAETPDDARVVRMSPRKIVKRGFFRWNENGTVSHELWERKCAYNYKYLSL